MKFTKRPIKAKQKQGFTVLELLIVVIVVGVLASLALPRMFSLVKRTYVTEAMEFMGWLHGRMEMAYVTGNGSYLPAWQKMLLLPDDATVPVGISRPEDAINAHFCYTVQVVSDQSYQYKAYYVGSAAETCPVGTPPGAYTSIPDYVEYKEDRSINKISYKGYGIFNGFGS